MSGFEVRREDKRMSEAHARELLASAYIADEIWLHNTRARGHLRANVDHEPRVCFEVDDAGEAFAYGRFECDTTVAYRSVVAFGRIRVIEDPAQKSAFFDALMQRYADPGWDRPKRFYPRLAEVTVYAIAVERMAGKATQLPPASQRWPAVDRTKTPNATP